MTKEEQVAGIVMLALLRVDSLSAWHDDDLREVADGVAHDVLRELGLEQPVTTENIPF